MKTRVISAIVMLSLVAVALYFGPVGRLLLVTVAASLGIYEMGHACMKMGRKVPKYLVIGYPVLYAALCWLDAPDWAVASLIIAYVIFILCFCVVRKDKGAEAAMNGLFALCYPGALFSCVMRIAYSDNWLFVCAIAAFSTWLCDCFAMLGGMAFGKHKLTPVSPKKTWEGTLFGAAFSLLGGAAVHWIWKDAPSMWICLVTALIASSLGQFGDLAASLIKRAAGLKDYSNLIPGHGGVMDRADSLLFSIPTAWLILKLFAELGLK